MSTFNQLHNAITALIRALNATDGALTVAQRDVVWTHAMGLITVFDTADLDGEAQTAIRGLRKDLDAAFTAYNDEAAAAERAGR